MGTTKYTLDNLVPGTNYDLRVYGISKYGNNGVSSSLEVETKIGDKQCNNMQVTESD